MHAEPAHDGATEVGEGGLQRVLGVPALFSTAYGNVGSSIYYALGLVATFALGLTPLAFAVAGLFFVMLAMTYAEGTAAFPEAGGSSSFARRAFNELVSFCTAWAQMLNYVITMAISAYFVPHYLGVFWAPLTSTPWDAWVAIAAILVLAVLNIVGVQETAALNVGLALADFGTQVLLALLGAFLLLSPEVLISNVHLWEAPTLRQLLVGITVGMIAYTGIETISNMAEETRDPVRSVPRAIGYVAAAVLSLYIVLPLVALSAMPVVEVAPGVFETTLGTEYASDPFIGFVREFEVPAAWMMHALEYYVGVLAAVILFIATNAAIIGVSRLSYSMGQYQQVPNALRALHPRFMTPWVSISIFSVIGCMLLLPPVVLGVDARREAEMLGNLYAFGAMLSFSIAHIAIIRLRFMNADLPWRGRPNLQLGNTSLPLFAIVGVLGTGAAFLVQVWLNPTERWIGLGWMVVGPMLYVFYRRHRGLSLTQTVRAPIIVQAPSADIAYHNILVPIIGGRLDHAAMVVACKLAAERGAQILAAAVLEVPQSLPLHAHLADAEWQANQQLDLAKAIGEEYGVDVITRLARGRRAESIALEEALRRESQLIVLGVHPRRHLGMSLVGRTNERILRKAPTRVLLVRERDDYAPASGGVR